MANPKYSICSVSYNMSDTIGESLKSMLDQIDERFEVFLFDESNDGSIEILKELKKEYDNFRFKHIEPDPDIQIGEAWNISAKNARGDYVLLHLDVDDKYKPGTIQDFVKIFEKLRANVDHLFYFHGPGLSIVEKDFFLNEVEGYKNLKRAEDNELWRRLILEDKVILLDNKPPFEEIGYHRDTIGKFKNAYKEFKSRFKGGETLLSNIRWCFTEPKYVLILPLGILAYFSVELGQTEVEPTMKLRDRMKFSKITREKKMTLKDLEENYGFSINKEDLESPDTWYK